MPGLLDFLNTPQGAGLLSGVASYAMNARRGTPVNNIGRGLAGGLTGYANAQDGVKKDAEDAYAKQFKDMQLQQAQQSIQDGQAQRDFFKNVVGSKPATSDYQPDTFDATDKPFGDTANGTPAPQGGAMQTVTPGTGLLGGKTSAADLPALMLGSNVPALQAKAFESMSKAPKWSVTERYNANNGLAEKVLMNENDPTQTMPFGGTQADKIVVDNMGGSNNYRGEHSVTPIATAQKSATPDALITDQRTRYEAAQNRAQSDQHFNTTQNNSRGQIVQSDNGPVLVDMRTGTGQAVMGQDGKPLPGVAKPLNDTQAKALGFGTRMQEADKVLQKLALEGTQTSIPGSNAPLIGGVISSLSSDNRQMLDQAKRDFTTAILRRESGAAISTGEFNTANKQYFPQIGDGPKVIAQKQRNRELAIQGTLIEVPAKQRGSITPASAAPLPKPKFGETRGGYYFKGGDPADSKSWVKQ